MSLDSRLFRPSRSNSNSASSALVSVGVSSVGSRHALGGRVASGHGRCSHCSLSAREPRAELAASDQRGHHRAVDALVGQGGVVVTHFEPDGQAAFVHADAGTGVFGL